MSCSTIHHLIDNIIGRDFAIPVPLESLGYRIQPKTLALFGLTRPCSNHEGRFSNSSLANSWSSFEA